MATARCIVRSAFGIAATASCLGGLSTVHAQTASRDADPAPRFVQRPGELEFSGQLTVRPVQTLTPDRDQAARARLAGITVKYYPETDEYIVSVPAAKGAAGAGENQLAAQLLATGLYQYAEPNWICYPVVTPNDPQFAAQWHHARMRTPDAWNYTVGVPGIISAVTDTGVDITHPDLTAHRVPGFNAVDDVAEVDGGQVNDLNGHGTHVAGCAAAIGNNATGVCGPAWNTRVMMVRVSNSAGGGASLDDITQGARWAIEHGAKIASSSYTGIASSSIQTSGAYIKSIGGLYCYAADNSNTNHSSFDWPDVIIVGASDESDAKAGFSSYGKAVDVFAPGNNIYSTCNGGGYCYASGTSMATPVANGVLALIWSLNPSFTPQQVEDFLEHGCDDWGAPGNDDTYGWGRVNALNSILLAGAAMGNQPPIANDDTAVALRDTPRRVDTLANDVDINQQLVSIQYYSPTSAAGGSITLSVGTGPGGRNELLYTPPAGFTGADSFTYTAADTTFLVDDATVNVTVYDASAFRTPENPAFTAPGVVASYYAIPGLQNLPNFSAFTPFKTEVVPQVNYASTDGVFAGSGLADNVAATFIGYITVPSTDFYTFYTNSDDGSRLLIGNTAVVNNDGLHGMVETAGTIGLQAGTHAVTVQFFENGGGAGVIASYSGGGLSKQVIPAAALVHGVCPADFNGDGFVTGDDFDAYVIQFIAGNAAADFNRDGFVTGDDFDAFVVAFEAGC